MRSGSIVVVTVLALVCALRPSVSAAEPLPESVQAWQELEETMGG